MSKRYAKLARRDPIKAARYAKRQQQAYYQTLPVPTSPNYVTQVTQPTLAVPSRTR